MCDAYVALDMPMPLLVLAATAAAAAAAAPLVALAVWELATLEELEVMLPWNSFTLDEELKSPLATGVGRDFDTLLLMHFLT